MLVFKNGEAAATKVEVYLKLQSLNGLKTQSLDSFLKTFPAKYKDPHIRIRASW